MIIQKVVTGIEIEDYNTSYDLPCAINDTFFCESDIKFICTINALNDLLSLSLSSGNISDYSLRIILALSDDETGNNSMDIGVEGTIVPFSAIINYDQTIELDNSNIINSNSIVVDLNSILQNVTHDLLLDSMTDLEIQKLYKKLKIVFRIYETGVDDPGNDTSYKDGDIVQDLNLVLNTYNSGPYGVNFSQVDICSPDDFSDSERKEFLEKNNIAGSEVYRIFYPEYDTNASNTIKFPLFVVSHGAGLFSEDYDHILSFLASYGYFCISVITYADDFEDSNPISAIPFLLKLEHFKNNINKIRGGIFENLIDFSKINLSGQSRGGGMTTEAIEILNNKEDSRSLITDINLNISDIKAHFPICKAAYGAFGNGSEYLYSLDALTTSNPNESTINNYFLYKAKIPTLSIIGKNDGQSPSATSVNDNQIGFDDDLNCNVVDKGVIFYDIGDHNWINCGYFGMQFQDLVGINQIIVAKAIGLNQENILFSNNIHARRLATSQILLFLSINNFSNSKLKKLRYISLRKRNQKTNIEKIPNHEIYFTQNNDIQYFIDSFKGYTLTLAGNTGFTFSNPLGFTYGIPLDNSYLSVLPEYLLAYVQNIDHNIYTNLGIQYQTNDDFNGIQGLGKSALYLPIESNVSLGYTFQENISLDENFYLGLRGALKFFFPSTLGNTFDAHFNLTLYDNLGNFTTTTSKNYSIGFEKPLITDNTTYSVKNHNYNVIPCICWFRAGDFYLKNTSLDLSNINQIQLDFGPDHGSTFAHIVLDEFVVYKEL
jgi:hypothetical protein